LKHQHHLHRPRSDAAHGRQPLNDFAVLERAQAGGVRHQPRECLGRQIENCLDFACREPRGPQGGGLLLQHLLRLRKGGLAARCLKDFAEATQDRRRGTPADLLADDRLAQMPKGRGAFHRAQSVGPGGLEQGRHDRIARAEVGAQLAPGQRWHCVHQ